jgi:N-acetylneuraminate synthase
MSSFRIQNRQIGDAFPPLVIAEIGINHNGSLSVAKKMVDAAARAGIEVVKHQTHIVDDEMSPHAKKVIPGNSKKSIYQIMDECSLSEQDEIKLQKYVQSKGMIFISTPFSRKAAIRLKKMNVPAFKIGSGECNNYPLIELVASYKKPIILSTGMNSISSIKPAVDIIRKNKIPYALLHTTNLYPTPNKLIRLNALKELKQEFPDAVIGLSDHSITNHACFGAVALGANILERHFTDTMLRKGPDIICSMNPQAASDLIKGSALIHESLQGKKEPVSEENVTINFAFASVVTIKAIKKGQKFSAKNIWVKRPGTGDFLAKDFSSIIGRSASRDLPMDHQIGKRDVT